MNSVLVLHYFKSLRVFSGEFWALWLSIPALLFDLHFLSNDVLCEAMAKLISVLGNERAPSTVALSTGFDIGRNYSGY